MAGIAITKKAKARKAEWERVCNLSPEELVSRSSVLQPAGHRSSRSDGHPLCVSLCVRRVCHCVCLCVSL